MESLVYILLASYNGEKYIEKQLESIVLQTYTNWCLLIRDDGSTDNTISIIKKYCNNDRRIVLVDETNLNKGNGACQNFGNLMQLAIDQRASTIMFCDQDDFWFPNKIEVMYNKMISSESEMLYSNFIYADENLNKLSTAIQDSMSPFIFPLFKSLIVQNHVYGCTMMISSELAKRCLPIPIVAENHDYWIALVASGTNTKIVHLNESLMLYRQHNTNVSGSFRDHFIVPRIKRFLFDFNLLEKREYKKILMLEKVLEQLNNQLVFDHKELLKGYLHALEKGRVNIIFYCIKNKIQRQSLLSTIIYYIVLCNLHQPKFFNR